MEDLLREILDELKDINRRITTPWPIIEPVEPAWSDNRCPKCKIDLTKCTMYVCSDPECPTGLGGTRCQV